MRDFTDELRDLRRRLTEAEEYLKVADGRDRLVELEVEVARPDLWDDAEHAKRVNAEYAAVKDDVETFDGLSAELADVELLHELAREEDDESQEPEITDVIASVSHQLDLLELRSLFIGEHD